MTEMTHVEGGCHCGAVRYEADVDLASANECNCSHCEKKGFILTFTPAANFKLASGEDKLTEYRFNKRSIQHLFCSVCGVQSFARGKMPDGAEMAAVNVRCIDGVDLSAINPTPVDGKSF